MKSIPKPKNLADLKTVINQYKGSLSQGNLRLINEIISEMEKSGGVNKGNEDYLMNLMKRLASNNGVKIPRKK